MARPKGPDKEQILIRLLTPTTEQLRAKAALVGMKLPTWLAEQIERNTDKFLDDTPEPP